MVIYIPSSTTAPLLRCNGYKQHALPPFPNKISCRKRRERKKEKTVKRPPQSDSFQHNIRPSNFQIPLRAARRQRTQRRKHLAVAEPQLRLRVRVLGRQPRHVAPLVAASETGWGFDVLVSGLHLLLLLLLLRRGLISSAPCLRRCCRRCRHRACIAVGEDLLQVLVAARGRVVGRVLEGFCGAVYVEGLEKGVGGGCCWGHIFSAGAEVVGCEKRWMDG